MANLQNNPTKEKNSTENIVVLPRRQSEDKAKTKHLLQSLPTFCPTAAKQKKQLLSPPHPLHLSHYLLVQIALLKQVQAV